MTTTRTPPALLVALALALVTVAGCIPARVKHLNAAGNQAMAKRDYQRAIAMYSESLSIYPDQPKVALKLDSAKVMLKQVLVFKIYDVVDGPVRPVARYLEAWKMSAQLPSLDVSPARVLSIRADLNKRFARAEPVVRKNTEPHDYYLHLNQMQRLVASPPVQRASVEVAAILKGLHLKQRAAADRAGRAGLALLHTAAAATFSGADTGLWVDVRKRRDALRRKLGIRVEVQARSEQSASHSLYLLGGIKRRLPEIFIVQPGAALKLQLQARRPAPDEKVVSDRLSGRCQVGTRRVKNPECNSLKSQAALRKRTYEQKLAALEMARDRCAGAKQASTCNNYLSSASRDVDSAKRSYEEMEDRVGKCPRHIDEPVFKTFFYKRFIISRAVSISGTVAVTRGKTVRRGRGVTGTASARDTYGEGLGCAKIAPDPMSIPSLSALRVQAEERMLDRSLSELYQMRRQLAREQLAGSSARDERLDALVRARLVDETFKLARTQLATNLSRMWSSDFELTERVVAH